VTGLLRFCRIVDRLSTWFGRLASVCVVLACLISAGNALSRYALGASSNAWLEIQWYLFGVMVLFGAAQTLLANEHVRVDILYGGFSPRRQAWIDLLGGLFFLLPAVVLIGWFSWSFFAASFAVREMSNNAGGLPRWPVKALLPLGFGLLALQAVAEVLKRAAVLADRAESAPRYEKPVQ
jgi:TRAP-type mannitol/chloroaromatic compound transport system permease small subunit